MKKLKTLAVPVLCIAAAAIVICCFKSPNTFKQIVSPVQSIAQTTLSNIKNFFNDKTKDKNPSDNAQIDEETGIMTRIDGVETLTGGNIAIVYFGQNDPEWKDQLYGEDPIGVYGCGPTSLAMVVNSLGTGTTNPALMSAFCAEHGYWAPKSGSYHNIIQGVASSFGLNCSAPASLDADELIKRLSGGEIAIALMGNGHFTDTGHFIVLRGITKDNKILLADPISRTRSLQKWDAQLIIDELSTSRSNGAPLWFLSVSQ